jgi:RNA-binding protein YlmH
MFDRDKILKCAVKQEDRLLLSKIVDKAVRASKTREVTYSDFLDPSQQHILERAMDLQDEITYELDGGYEGAERAVAFFYPVGQFYSEGKNPIAVLKVTVKNGETLTHRDYLGTLMGLGIKREKVGDILVSSEGCSILAQKEVSDYILYNLIKVGRNKTTVDYADLESLETPDREIKVIKTTVASMRLDCIISSGYGISRSRASEFIKAERVSINWEKKTDISAMVKHGDTISVRGRGRLIVENEGQKTKKGRIAVVLNRLI